MNPEHRLAQTLLRAWPFPRGAGRLLDLYFTKLSFTKHTETVRTTDDFEITIIPNEAIGRHLYLTGEFDRSIVELLCAFSRPGDTLLDVGANIGYVSSCFLHNVVNSAVIAVEPFSELVEILTANLNRFGKSQIYPFAISDKDGEAWFEVNRSNMGAGRIVGGCGVRTTRVSTRSATSLFSDMAIEKLDLVKVDAEGSEGKILESCREHLLSLQPRAIIFEDNNGAIGILRPMFEQIGYTIFGIRKYLTRLKLIKEADGCHDYVAVSNARTLPSSAMNYF
jgi:FkbM family methyltransferase